MSECRAKSVKERLDRLRKSREFAEEVKPKISSDKIVRLTTGRKDYERFNRWCEESELSLGELAKKFSTSHVVIGQWRTGKRRIPPSVLELVVARKQDKTIPGYEFRDWREKMGLSRGDVASMFDYDADTVLDWEEGREVIPITVVFSCEFLYHRAPMSLFGSYVGNIINEKVYLMKNEKVLKGRKLEFGD